MVFLSSTEKQNIERAIAEAELKTSGELVAVIAHSSDDYLYVSLLWAALVALMTPGLIALSALPWLLDWQYAIQICTFFVLALIFRWPPMLSFIVPRTLKHRRAHRLAMEQFLSHNLQQTRERSGVLLFVSVAEHYVEIIADEGISARVTQMQWESIITDFTQAVRTDRVAEGFIHAATACGELLEKHFPRQAQDQNELPNHLVEI